MLELNYEQALFKQGYQNIAGVDEAGRGPLAGPVVAAAVVIPRGWKIPASLSQVRDSKKLSPRRRAELYQLLTELLPAYGIGSASHKQIDQHNILHFLTIS